jgi:hypothetical protein
MDQHNFSPDNNNQFDYFYRILSVLDSSLRYNYLIKHEEKHSTHYTPAQIGQILSLMPLGKYEELSQRYVRLLSNTKELLAKLNERQELEFLDTQTKRWVNESSIDATLTHIDTHYKHDNDIYRKILISMNRTYRFFRDSNQNDYTGWGIYFFPRCWSKKDKTAASDHINSVIISGNLSTTLDTLEKVTKKGPASCGKLGNITKRLYKAFIEFALIELENRPGTPRPMRIL